MINQGEQLGQTEATETFFAMTKLFQSKDVSSRRANRADERFVLRFRWCYDECSTWRSRRCPPWPMTWSLSHQVWLETWRAKKIRIVDPPFEPCARSPMSVTLFMSIEHSLDDAFQASMMQSVERYMKQAIVDKLSSVSSAALTSSMHLMRQGPEVVKRWVNEVQEAVNNENIMVQYHALGLLYQIRRSDKHAIRKLISKFSKAGLRSPYAYCFLVRQSNDALMSSQTYLSLDSYRREFDQWGRRRVSSYQVTSNEEQRSPSLSWRTDSPMYDFIDSCLRNKHEMVTYEAASTIVSLKCVTSKELSSAVNVLQLFLSSPKPVSRYAAVRTLNRVRGRSV